MKLTQPTIHSKISYTYDGYINAVLSNTLFINNMILRYINVYNYAITFKTRIGCTKFDFL